MLTARKKNNRKDWHWTSISAIFGFTFSNQVLTPDIYGAHWFEPIVIDDNEIEVVVTVKLLGLNIMIL